MLKNNMRFINKNILITILFSLFSLSAFGADDVAATESARSELLSAVFQAIHVFAFLFGIFTFIFAAIKLAEYGSGRNPNITGSKIAISFIVAGVLLNITATINTIYGEFSTSEHCFVYDVNIDSVKEIPTGSSCFDPNSSPLAQKIKAKLQKDNKSSELINSNLRFALGIFQIIGLVYFLMGWNLVLRINNGKEQNASFTKPLFMILGSSIIMDLPHTLSFIAESLKTLSIFNF